MSRGDRNEEQLCHPEKPKKSWRPRRHLQTSTTWHCCDLCFLTRERLEEFTGRARGVCCSLGGLVRYLLEQGAAGDLVDGHYQILKWWVVQGCILGNGCGSVHHVKSCLITIQTRILYVDSKKYSFVFCSFVFFCIWRQKEEINWNSC